MNYTKRHRLSPKQLTRQLPTSWLPLKTTTSELRSYRGVIGQERAMRAVEVGLKILTRGFNIYAAGDAGSGKTTTIERLLTERAKGEAVSSDLVYVHNFRAPSSPTPIQLPPGRGRILARDMEKVVEELVRIVPQVLSEGAFGHIRAVILADTHTKAAALLQHASEAAAKLGLTIEEEESGLRMVPLLNGKPIEQETFEKLSPSRRRRIEANILAFQEHLEAYSYRRRQLEIVHNERLLAAEVRAITPLVTSLISPLLDRYRRFDDVVNYLQQVQQHLLDNHHRCFIPPEEETDEEPAHEELERHTHEDLCIYQVNVVVDRTDQNGAPVVIEAVPSPANLCGFFEYRAEQGRLATDHTMIRAGALHQANGGYLLLQMSDLLLQENAWDSLKRALRHKQVRIEEEASLGEGKVRLAGMLKPGSVPLKIKVVLIGSLDLYYYFKLEDEDFGRLFKVMAEFEDSMTRTRENVMRMARFLGQVCTEEGYLPVHRSGMIRMVEIASRRAEHKDRMTTHRAELLDILAEANFFARQTRAKAIRRQDIDQALAESRARHAAASDHVDRAIHEGAILIRTRGRAVGQINGIALYNLAGNSFGVPVRITVRTYVGRRGVVNIDREVDLSGAIHDKGGMILVGLLGGRYAQEHTLGLSASITFEQSYDEIDGDSASSAELYALLSALSDCPIRQGIAVTGSVNQLGEIQPIGGVNAKIEGIYRICHSRGLTGEEGVLIPRANVRNLMLEREVIEAVRNRRFNVYAVSTVDEGIEVLTGVAAGTMRKDGTWTPGSINDRVQGRLLELQRILRAENPLLPTESRKKL